MVLDITDLFERLASGRPSGCVLATAPRAKPVDRLMDLGGFDVTVPNELVGSVSPGGVRLLLLPNGMRISGDIPDAQDAGRAWPLEAIMQLGFAWGKLH